MHIQDDDVRSMPETIADGNGNYSAIRAEEAFELWSSLDHPDYHAPKSGMEQLIKEQKAEGDPTPKIVVIEEGVSQEGHHRNSGRETESANINDTTTQHQDVKDRAHENHQQHDRPSSSSSTMFSNKANHNNDTKDVQTNHNVVLHKDENQDPNVLRRKYEIILEMQKWKLGDIVNLSTPLHEMEQKHELESIRRIRAGNLHLSKKAVSMTAGAIAMLHNKLDPILPFMRTGVVMDDWQKEVDYALQESDEMDDALQNIADKCTKFLGNNTSSTLHIAGFLAISYQRAVNGRMKELALTQKLERAKIEEEQKKKMEEMNKSSAAEGEELYANQFAEVNKYRKNPANAARILRKTQQAAEEVKKYFEGQKPTKQEIDEKLEETFEKKMEEQEEDSDEKINT